MKWFLLAMVIVPAALGDLLQSREMKLAGKDADTFAGPGRLLPGPARILKLIAKRRYLLLAIFCLALSFFAFLALVQTEPISFAVPASAGSFVVETLLATLWLKERSSPRKILGTLVVFGGLLLVAR